MATAKSKPDTDLNARFGGSPSAASKAKPAQSRAKAAKPGEGKEGLPSVAVDTGQAPADGSAIGDDTQANPTPSTPSVTDAPAATDPGPEGEAPDALENAPAEPETAAGVPANAPTEKDDGSVQVQVLVDGYSYTSTHGYRAMGRKGEVLTDVIPERAQRAIARGKLKAV